MRVKVRALRPYSGDWRRWMMLFQDDDYPEPPCRVWPYDRWALRAAEGAAIMAAVFSVSSLPMSLPT
ncbi:hypothetical protein, partial [Stenotrophomonas maltophilia]|uniref:hypothetical protein n=1 Tax=Stenotrophomonas maltophilia TaxID=40324 RepID=UPI001952EA1C